MKRIGTYCRRNPASAATVIIVVIACAFLIVKNVNTKGFFIASAVDILTILLGAVIAFFLTERKNDVRRRNDCIEHVIMEIESFVSEDDNFKYGRSALMGQTSCANRIKYLKDARFKEIENDIAFVETHFEEIRNLYSNHNSAEEELNSVKKDIDRNRNLVTDKCCKIRIGLYSDLSLTE